VSPFMYEPGWIIIYPLFLSFFTVFERIIYFLGKELHNILKIFELLSKVLPRIQIF